MAADASQALGEAEIAGTFVNPKGMAKKMTAAVAGQQFGGAAGGFAARMRTGDAYEGAPDVPQFGRVGYLAVSSRDLALVKTKTGALKMKISDEVLGRVLRSDIAAVAFDEGRLLSHLRIDFTNGACWEFDVPKAGKKTAKALVEALGGTTR